jgi:AcrR family transcriptional regulator
MSRRPDPRNQRSRTAIKQALVRLLATRPFDEVLVREIVEAAGIGNATFFRHYRDKLQVLEDVAQDFFDEASAAMLPALGERMGERRALMLCRFVDEHRVVYTALLAGGAASRIRADFIEKTAARAMALLPQAATRLPGRLAAIYPTSAVIAILGWWLGEAPDTPLEDVSAMIARLVFKPLEDF